MFTLNCSGRLLVIEQPLVMGVINITPDSFYLGSRLQAIDEVLKQAENMLKEKADIIDIGGQSTRPQSTMITAEEELIRVIPVIEALQKNFPETFLSIDTFYSRVAKQAVAAGASIVNDISAGRFDKDLLPAVAELKIPYVLMHMKGKPQTMQQHCDYENVTREVLDFLISKKAECHAQGIKDVIIDPGFGFAKTIEQNFQLLKELAAFKMLDAPILAGLSRKSTIYKTLGITAEEALNGTTVLNTIALMNGATILRVHDVKEAKEAVTLYTRLKK
ncbi:MAG: dihydropteroate synthase [Chitinophagaceae bacterium]